MLIEHRGFRPEIDPSAWVAPTAVVSGAVRIGPGARVLHGAVLTAEGGKRTTLSVGPECVVMEQAVLRAAGRFSLSLGPHVLVGPHAHLSGCVVGPRCFIATAAMIFNGARLGDACTVALGATVHVDTELADETFVPIGYIAFGRPARLYPPDEAPQVHEEMKRIGFMRYVFGVDPEGKTRGEVIAAAVARYSRALGAHREDVALG